VNRLVVVLLGAALAAAAFGRELGFEEYPAVHDSLRAVPPKLQESWLHARRIDIPGITEYRMSENTGLRMVGKYGRGRAWEVTGQDSFVYAVLGSEAAILDFANPAQPRLVSEIQLDYLPVQVAVTDSVLLTGRNGIDLWDIAAPASPVKLSHIPSLVSDFAVVDTLLYFVSSDTFNAYSIANPVSAYRLGFCLDSGYVATATANTAVLLMDDFMAFVDVRNPAAPHRVGTYGGWSPAAVARGNLCCAAFVNPSQLEESWFSTIDISDPANPRQLARLDSVCGWALDIKGGYAFLSGRHNYELFQVVSIADSLHPVLLGELGIAGERWGVWADLARSRAYVGSDYAGLQVIDVSNPSAPALDTVLLKADMAEDVAVEGNLAYVADYSSCLKMLDISDPTRPTELGGIDSAHVASEAVAAHDSFAYIEWIPFTDLHSICVSDPAHPTLAGGGAAQTLPGDMVLRDTLLYIAGRLRFNVINVARPRQPSLVGSCTTQDGVYFGLVVQDTLAYTVGDGFQIVNTARPDSPFLVSTTTGGASGLAVRDTFAYIPDGLDTVHIYSVANPTAPHVLSAVPCDVWPWDVALGESKLYVGTSDGWGVDVYDLTNPGQPVRRGRASAPTDIRRLQYAGGYLYAAMWDAGVAIFETTQVAIAEPKLGESKLSRNGASVVRGVLNLEVGSRQDTACRAELLDVSGRKVLDLHPGENDVRTLAPGVYFVRQTFGAKRVTSDVTKVIITR